MSDCILTTWPLNADGYGRRRNRLHHRVVWEEAHGPIPDGIEIRHACDNPPCINLDHLVPGTHADNMADRAERLTGARGEAVHTSKLSEEDVRMIRFLAQSGQGVRELGRRYGVAHSTVRKIVNGEAWRHLP